MKIVVVSDTHGDLAILERIIEENKDAILFIHAGDSQIPPYAMPLFKSVKGNCDYGYDYPMELTLKTPYGDIFITHGHQYFSINEKVVKSKHCKIFIFGHTHKHYLNKIDDIYVCNPGSPTRPRDNTKGTYLIIDLDEKSCDFTFKYL